MSASSCGRGRGAGRKSRGGPSGAGIRKFGSRGSKRLAIGIELSRAELAPRDRGADLPLEIPHHLLALGSGVGDAHDAFRAFDIENGNHFAFLRFRGAALLPKGSATTEG